MKSSRGFTLIELLISVAIMAVISTIIYPFFTTFQFQSLSEINKSDLGDRANRLLDYLAEEVRETGFLVTSVPRYGDDTVLSIKHFSSPLTFSNSIVVGNTAGGNDSLDLVKAVSFFPRISVTEVITGTPQKIKINRPPDYTSEINNPGANQVLARNNVIFENHKKIYRVTGVAADSPDIDVDGDGRKDRLLSLYQTLAEAVPVGTEVLGVRAVRFYVDSQGLRNDDYVTAGVLDSNVDGLQIKYFMANGSYVDAPVTADIEKIRGIKIYLLVKAGKPDRHYVNSTTYSLGGQSYGPFADNYRRVLVERLVEVKNYALE